jgi:capsid protein
MNPQVMYPLWRAFVSSAVTSGLIVRPSGMNDYKLFRCKFIPTQFKELHHLQSVQAKVLKLQNRFTSRDEIIEEESGSSTINDVDAMIDADPHYDDITTKKVIN